MVRQIKKGKKNRISKRALDIFFKKIYTDWNKICIQWFMYIYIFKCTDFNENEKHIQFVCNKIIHKKFTGI